MNNTLTNLDHCPTCQVPLIKRENNHFGAQSSYTCENPSCPLALQYSVAFYHSILEFYINPRAKDSFLIYYYFNNANEEDFISIYRKNPYIDHIKRIQANKILTYQDFTNPLAICNKINLLLTF